MKKTIKTIAMLALVLGSTKTIAQNTAINSTGTAPDASAMLDVSSTTKGLLTPRMTSAQRTAITTPATGLIVYQTNGTDGYYYYDGSSWVLLMNTDASNLASGTVPTARLGSGIADNTTYLRGDGTWATPSSSISDNSILGTKFKYRTVSSNTTLDASDFIVMVSNASIITLPLSPVDGQIYWVGGVSSASIDPNGKDIIFNASTYSSTFTFTDLNDNSLMMVYSSTIGKWVSNW